MQVIDKYSQYNLYYSILKNILTIILLVLSFIAAQAQAPQGIPYQAIARNSVGAPLANTTISVRFTVRDNSATGVTLYRETHTVTTSPQGMFSLTVGQGTPTTGTFASINWGTNAKFMRVELDPTGGSSYIDMGTLQMMSVPYALNAGTLKFTVSNTGDTLHSGNGNFVIVPGISAANCTVSAGTITGTAIVAVGSTTALSSVVTGGVWSSSASGIATVGSTGEVTGVATGTATVSYTVTNGCGSAVATRVVTVNAASLTIGTAYAGGVVAYILQPGDPGYIAGEIRGLIAAPSDQSSGIWWFNGSFITTGATDTVLGTGMSNTNLIVAVQGAGSYAAKLCADLVLNGYDDWYLPSRDELIKLCINRVAIGGFANASYWTSNETIFVYSRSVLFLTNPAYIPSTESYGSKVELYKVRAVRNFSYPESILGTSAVCVGNTIILSSATTGGSWSSSNVGVATVGSSSGVVSGVTSGTAVISYTATGIFGTSTTTRIVTVDATTYAGTITGAATVSAYSTTTLSNATTGGAWSSSASGIATVGSTGVVTGVAAGTATISYTVTNDCGSAVATRVVTVTAASLTVGAFYGGGIVAYFLQPGDPGYVAGETHGLIAAPSDQSMGLIWWNGSFVYVPAIGVGLGTGMANTNTIVATQGEGIYAAKFCADLVLNGYSDWYLPSRGELQKLYDNRSSIGGFSTGSYWSSSNYSHNFSWSLSFSTGTTQFWYKDYAYYVRAVRSF